MKFDIEVYKGQAIVYNDDSDKFECDIEKDNKVKSTKRSSLSDVRKEIDTFIKLNADFKPFKMLKLDYDSKDFTVKEVLAIRTDGKFIINGTYKEHYSKKDMAKGMVYDEDIVEAKKDLYTKKEAALSEYFKSVRELCSKLQPLDLSKYEHIINPE